MRTLTDLKVEPDQMPSWLSTHPDHGDREKRIDKMLGEILKYRNKAGVRKLIDTILKHYSFRYF